MSPDREVDVVDRRDHSTATSSQGESNFGDSSGPLFSIYSKASEDEDNKMAERWQKDADGILIFTGLFSAAVAALLAVSVQDLRPNSQDTSAFHLGNIYQVLADPNVTSTPSPPAKPAPFSPPRYAVWVNSLWFLSLVMSLSCALWATSIQQWARRYLRRAQPARCSPEKRARMRAFFAEGVDKMRIPWAVEGLPMLLHLSLFLFFGGLAVFLSDVDYEVFSIVTPWIVGFSFVYGLTTVLPIFWHDSPYHSPLSTPAWFLYASIQCIAFKICASNTCSTKHCYLRDRYQRWMLGGVEKAAEETASDRSSKIDVNILDWTIGALGDDDSLKSFFEAIPGFFNSKLVKNLERVFPPQVREKLRDTLGGFLSRTWSSNSVGDSEKVCRLEISINAINRISPKKNRFILPNILFQLRDEEVPQTVEIGHTLASWYTTSGRDIPVVAQRIIAEILVRVGERNDSWVMLAARTFGLPESALRNEIAFGDDSVLLSIFIDVTRQSRRSRYSNWMVLEALSQLDICNTLPGLQHDFCMLWNEIVREAHHRWDDTTPVAVLNTIRHLYTSLHLFEQTAFSYSTNHSDPILSQPSTYNFCNTASHLWDSTSYLSVPLLIPRRNSADALSPSPTPGGNTASRQAEQVSIVVQPPSSSNLTTTGEIGATSHDPDITPPTSPVHFSSHPRSTSPTAVAATASQEITSTATLSHPLGGSEQQDSDKVTSSAEPETCQILSTASTHAPTPTLAPIPTSFPNTPSEPYDGGIATVANSSHFAPSPIDSSILVSRPIGSATLPCLRARGLVNTGNICFANAVLQMLVNSPPFWSLFRELGDLKGQRGVGVPETGGGATPLVDATVRFFKEFIVEEESPSIEQQSQPATGGASRVDEEKKDDNAVDFFGPMYLYDVMKEKKQLKPLLNGQQQDAEEFLCLYLDALDEELPALLASNSGRQSANAALEVEQREVSQSDQTEVGSKGFMANFVESPITRIFGGKFCSHVHTSNQPDLVTTEGWRSLHLDILSDSVLTVHDALTRISPTRDDSDPTGLSDASQQMLIEAFPPVLVLHKRFRYDAASGGVIKIDKPVHFSSELEIPLDIMVPNGQRPSELPHYKLYGVLYHHGESAVSGHYTVDVLRQNGDGSTGEAWLHINDEAVSPMRYEDVFGEHSERVADGRCAYLLFYCRTSPIGTS